MRGYLVSLALLTLTLGCGGRSSTVTSSSSISGAYEFVVTSNVTGSTTLIEANLKANSGQSVASGPSQVQILARENKVWYVNGICFGSTPGQNTVSTNLSGNNITVAFDQGGNSFGGPGVMTGTTITGNYSVTGSSCPDLVGLVGVAPPGSDFGGFIGNQVPPLAGTFAGVLNLPSGADNASLTLTEDTQYGLTVKAGLKGPMDNGTFTFSGSAVGNVMFISGSINGSPLKLFGYYDPAGSFTGVVNSLLVFDYDTSTQAGLLTR